MSSKNVSHKKIRLCLAEKKEKDIRFLLTRERKD
jgi:hypothetical protein